MFLCCLSCPSLALAVDDCALLSQAERLFQQRNDMPKARAAVEFYRKVLQDNPDSLAASIKLARLLIFIGAQHGPDEEGRYYHEAMEVSLRATHRHPADPGPHYWLGVASGLLADVEGGFKALKLVDVTEQQMETVIKLDPAYDYGGAYRVLGRLHTKLPFIVGGDKDKAERYLRLALKLGPKYMLNHLYLADLLMETDRFDEAEIYLRQVLTASTQRGLEPEDKLWKMHAGDALEHRILVR